MEIKTFNTILTELCDSFDTLIAPRTMSRSDTNVIYLMFKAIAKGFEVINNVCVAVSNKFDVENCSDDDLESIASLVGTAKQSGSGSGLQITVTNNAEVSKTLKAGFYYYALDDDTTFEFEVTSDVTIPSGSFVSYIAMTQTVGSYAVTAQTSITVTTEQSVDSSLVFSCSDNSSLLGTSEETDLAFRKRILTDTDAQNTFVRLENKLKALPYIFDCKVKFNNTVNDITYDGLTIPSYTAVIFYSGEVKSELAEKVAETILCPTLKTANSVAVNYKNTVFAGGTYEINLVPFAKTEYTAEIVYKLNSSYANPTEDLNSIRTTLYTAFVGQVHKDYVKEEDFYSVIRNLSITGIEILGINLKYNESNVNYIEVPIDRIPELTDIIFTQGD